MAALQTCGRGVPAEEAESRRGQGLGRLGAGLGRAAVGLVCVTGGGLGGEPNRGVAGEVQLVCEWPE